MHTCVHVQLYAINYAYSTQDGHISNYRLVYNCGGIMDHIELYKIEAVYSTRYSKCISIFSTHKICMEVYLPNLLI